MKTSIVVDISSPVPYLAKYWVSSYGPKCCRLVKLHDSLKCNISREKSMMNFIFGVKINIKFFYKLILLFWVFGTRHAPKYPKISLLILQCFQKNMKKSNIFMKLTFLPGDKHKILNKLIVSLWVCIVRHAQKIQNNKFTISLQNLKENMKDEVDYHFTCVWPGMPKLPKIKSLLFSAINIMYVDKHESLLKIDTMILMGMVKHFQSSHNSQFCNVLTISQKRN